MRKERTPLYRSIVEKGGSPCYVFNAGTYEAGELVAEGIVDGKSLLPTVYALRNNLDRSKSG